MLIRDFVDAFQVGKALSNAETWKNAQVLTAKLTILLGALLGIAAALGYDFGLTEMQVGMVAGAISIVVGMFNGTATLVSSPKVGLWSWRKRPSTGGDDGAGDEDTAGGDSKQLRLDGVDSDDAARLQVLEKKYGLDTHG